MSSVQKPKSCLSLVMYIRPTLMSRGIFTTTLTSSRPIYRVLNRHEACIHDNLSETVFRMFIGLWVTRRMQVTRRTNKTSDLLAWWTLGTRHDTNEHASLRPASAQVSSRFRAGFGPASIMDFGLYSHVYFLYCLCCDLSTVLNEYYIHTNFFTFFEVFFLKVFCTLRLRLVLVLRLVLGLRLRLR